MLLSPRKNSLDSLFKEVRLFKRGEEEPLSTFSSLNSWGFLGFPLFSQPSQCF